MIFGSLLLAVCLGLIPAFVAQSKGRSFLAWWFYGAMLWIVAMPWSLMLKPDQALVDARQLETGDSKRCPHCAEIIREQAKVCRFCGRDVLVVAGN
jgi:hypothetical protein